MGRLTSSSKQLWPIPAWVLTLSALVLVLFVLACYILFWPRHPYAPRSGPVPQSQQGKHLAPPSMLSQTAPAQQTAQQPGQAATPASQPVLPPPPVVLTVPASTVITVRTGALIDGDADAVGSRFDGTVVSPVAVNGQTAVPQGSVVVLRLADKKKTGFFHRSMQMKVALAGVSVNGRIYPTQAETIDLKPGDQDGNENAPTPKGKKTLVVLPNTELTFTLSTPLTIVTPSGNGGQ